MTEVIIAASVLAIIGAVLGIGLSYASKVFHVKVDEKVQQVREALPGANCGACNYVGCDAYAEAIVNAKEEVNLCVVGGNAVVENVASIMGVSSEGVKKMVARVLCNGHVNVSKQIFNYQGIEDCHASTQIFGGQKSCNYGCVGLGSCVRACPYNAIAICEGIAKVSEECCKACGKCVAACPKKLIEMVPVEHRHIVLCRSIDKGAPTKKKCEVGCIGCMRCVKECKFGAITVENNLAKIDDHLCTNCGACVLVCPTKAIKKL